MYPAAGISSQTKSPFPAHGIPDFLISARGVMCWRVPPICLGRTMDLRCTGQRLPWGVQSKVEGGTPLLFLDDLRIVSMCGSAETNVHPVFPKSKPYNFKIQNNSKMPNIPRGRIYGGPRNTALKLYELGRFFIHKILRQFLIPTPPGLGVAANFTSVASKSRYYLAPISLTKSCGHVVC